MPVIPPVPDKTDQCFWDGVAERRLLIQRCTQCGTLRLPPVPMCGTCHALTWDTLEASGEGTVYTWILSHPPNGPTDPARIVVLVQLDEGVRVVSNLCAADPGGTIDPADVGNDMPVRLCFREVDGVLLPQFHPVRFHPVEATS
ncbi:MAG: hypothetical protein JWM34_5308 [Ilumatobacteraceae bacterium]|nr:hypothetical protein [Ilumatobacteraceae bacterium]